MVTTCYEPEIFTQGARGYDIYEKLYLGQISLANLEIF